ncbi:hypothetical protein [Phenylobacterium sp.]|uniref:hypothetical protein n=1 Tax=Phenylobacterium sp. TaxID=1871053 RepID=UPI00301BC827
MMRRRDLLALGAAMAAGRAFALDAGTATGRYGGEDGFGFSHALALAVDNAEGFEDSENSLRVLLSDRPVPPSALCGLAFPPVWSMATKGELKGLLLRFDPADRESLVVTVLTAPEPGYSLMNTTFSSSEGLWSRLEVSATRVVGELSPAVSDDMAFGFSAPVFTNPVEADLKGAAAAASEPVKVLRARAEALGRRDLDAVAALSTPSAAEGLRQAPPEMMKQAPRFAAEMIRRLKSPRRVVIRRETAAVMLGPGEWASVSRIDGAWKAAN